MRNSPIAKLRLWYTQTVLPLIYDYSLSLYELICKMADSLNKTIEAVDELDDKVDGIQEQINEMGIPQIDDRLDGIDQNLTDLTNDIDNIENNITNLGDIVTSHTEDLQSIRDTLADHETRISILEGYAFEGITPATKAYVDDHDDILKQYIYNNYITDLQSEIDALVGGGYSPVYGDVDFGEGVLLRYDPTIDDPSNPDKMVVASRDFKVSAAYVQALNMVYGCIYVSMSEGAEINAIPADTYVLCWKNSEDLPPVAHDFPGVAVKWSNEKVVPDLIKFGQNYNNQFTKRCDTFFTPRRNQYPEVIGNGYKWYSEVYLNNIEVGSPVKDWAILQIPFCYLSIGSDVLVETDIYNIEEPVTKAAGAGYIDCGSNLVSMANIGRSNCKGFGIEFELNSDFTPNPSGTYAGTFFSASVGLREPAIALSYRSDSEKNYIRFYHGNTNTSINNVIRKGSTYKVIVMYGSSEDTITVYDGLGDVVGSGTMVYNPEDQYTVNSVLFGFINSLGNPSQMSYGTIDKFRFFVLN